MKKMTQQDGSSLDMVTENLGALQGIFPEAFSEDGVNFEVLRVLLGDAIADGEEKYGFAWHGKRKARQIALTPSLGTLRPCQEESVDWDTTQNLFIEGDNLEVLKLLQKSYANKVKMIYIDPPYNTGKEFIYPDKFQDNLGAYLKYTGQRNDEGFKVSSNTESSGRYHTNWLNMMLPRLKLARGLLKDDGVIFVSIDDNETHHLRTVMDDIFGEENYLVTLYGQVRYSGKTLVERNNYQKIIEQTFVYQKRCHKPIKGSKSYSLEKFCWEIIEKVGGQKMRLGSKEVTMFRQEQYEIKKVPESIDALKETWATGAILKTSGKYFATHLAPRKTEDGLGILYKVEGIGDDGLGYRYFTGPKRETATKGKFYSGVPTDRRSQIESGLALKYTPIINFKDFAGSFGNCRHEGEVDFRAGKKPTAFIKFLLDQAIEKDGVVLDFFSGSGSVAHAVMNKNLEHGSLISYIMVQLPELIAPAENDEFANIAELGKERIRRAAAKIKEENPDYEGDLGFKVFKLDSSNIRAWNPDRNDLEQTLSDHTEHLVEGRSQEDVLYELLLKRGVELTAAIEEKTIASKAVYSIGYGVLYACLDTSINRDEVEDLAMGIIDWHTQPGSASDAQLVFRDSAFEDDVAKTNMTTILEQHGIAHVRSL